MKREETTQWSFQNIFPYGTNLTPGQRDMISGSLLDRTVKRGTVLHSGGAECTGLLLVRSGQLRAFILSEEGRGGHHLPAV